MRDLHPVLLLGLVFITVVTLSCASDSQDDGREAAQKSSYILANLYSTLRNIASQSLPYSAGDATHNRFVFMSPGTVLNYMITIREMSTRLVSRRKTCQLRRV